MIFQFPITIDTSAVGDSAASILNNTIFLAIFGFFIFWAAAVAVVLVLRWLLRKRNERSLNFKKTIFLIVLPKEAGMKKGEQEKEQTIRDIQEKIAVVEGVFSNLGVLKAEKGLKTWFTGRGDTFALEMVLTDGLIYFYAAAPHKYRDYLSEQIHAQYPDAQIDEVPDYNMFKPQGVVQGVYLRFKKNSLFPIKTYKKLESDPLLALANALSKAHRDDGVAIQILFRPAKPGVSKKAVKVAREMQKGKSISEALAADSWLKPLSALFKKKEKPEATEKARTLSPLEQEAQKSIEEKASKAWLSVNVRVVASGEDAAEVRRYLDNVVNAFGQFNIYEFGNSFEKRAPMRQGKLISDFIHRIFNERNEILLNTEEMASLYHFPLPQTEIPNIHWLLAKVAPPPANMPTAGLFLGNVNYRGQDTKVFMKEADRRRHMYIVGKSGVGKSEFLKQMIKQDIDAGRGICTIDPHGELARDIVSLVPKERAEDVIYFNPADVERPMGLNLLEYDERYPEQKTFVVNEMLKIFDKLYDLKATGGPMFEQYMRNAMILVMDHPESGSTLLEIPRVLADEKFRAFKLSKCKTDVVKNFWTKEAQKAGGEASLANMVPYITSKLAPFITNDIVRPIIGQQKSAFNVRQAMDEGKILLLDLSKGKLGDLNAYLIGMVLVGKILMAALSRTDMESSSRRDFYLYIDEFQNFITDSIATILSEARKYGLDLIIAHQYIAQLTKGADTTIRDAIFGNVGTMAAFRIGADDAEFLGKEFAPVFSPFDLINTPALTANVKLLIDGTAARPFRINLPPMVKGDNLLVESIQKLSRLKYGRAREIVEIEIAERARFGNQPGPLIEQAL